MTDEQLTVSSLVKKARSLRENERGGDAYLLEKAAETLTRVTAGRDRLRAEMRRYLPVIERCEKMPAMWSLCTKSTGIATANGYRAALQEAEDE